MGKNIRQLLNNEKGFSLIIVGISMVFLLGIVGMISDFGNIMLTRQKLINAVDSGALAGSLVLNVNQISPDIEAKAMEKVHQVCIMNGATENEVFVEIVDRTISVSATKTVTMIFLKIFGIENHQVSAQATALTGGIDSYLGIAPLSIKDQPLTYGEISSLKFGLPDSPGNFGALALAGKGASNYKNNLINGFSQEVSIGEILMTEPGNMSGPTDGIDERINKCLDGCTYDNFKPGCPKALIIPMFDNSLQGRDEIIITNFAVFFVDRAISESDEIMGYFVRMASNGTVNPSRYNSDLYSARLIK
ncbi:MAG: hypothetical protein HGA27_05905 [Peptococcaceae bacterium]|nr:hypothetical protein [Peptococcaceae bacterium]